MSIDYQLAFKRKERELQLIMALDHVRDTLHDDEEPQAMFEGMATLLKEHFNSDACAIMLVAETSDDIECIAHIGFSEQSAIAVCQQAMTRMEPGSVSGSIYPHTLGVQVILDDFTLGGLALGRRSEPYTDEERDLLTLAESQVDSAVVQARMVWKLLQRNRELEAIYEIDRLRDRTSSETDLISGFTAVLLRHFKADLCMMMLTHMDSGELVIRGIVDKHDLPAAALDNIRSKARELNIAQVIPTPAGVEDLVLLASPFIVAGARLGAIVVGREEHFTINDHRLLTAMTTQMDSAVVYSRILQQLSLRKKELEIIYRIDRIRDQEKDFDSLLQAVLTELCEAVSSEMGYIMLYKDSNQQELELRSFTVDGLLNSPQYSDVIQRVSRDALNSGELVYYNQPGGAVRSIIAVPLILNERVIGVFGAVNSTQPRGFSNEDRRVLSAITSQVDTAVFERLEQRRMRALLSRSVDPKVLEHLLRRTDASLLSGEKVNLSVLFGDLRGSTEWTERTQPEELVHTLNSYLEKMTDVIFRYNGTLDKYVGDEVIGLFGTPLPMEDHAYYAARAALEMQAIHEELRNSLKAQGRDLPPMGIAISTGEAIAGEFGHPIRTDFTALGRIVNLGARLCSAADPGQVLMSEQTYQSIRHLVRVNELEPLTLKGISQPVAVYELLSIDMV